MAVLETGMGVIPYLTIPSGRAHEAIALYRDAFGAREIYRDATPQGRLAHARLEINGGILFLGDELPEHGHRTDITPEGVTLHLYVDDVDALWMSALAAGCHPILGLADQAWGDRYGRLRDPFGHIWSIASPIKR